MTEKIGAYTLKKKQHLPSQSFDEMLARMAAEVARLEDGEWMAFGRGGYIVSIAYTSNELSAKHDLVLENNTDPDERLRYLILDRQLHDGWTAETPTLAAECCLKVLEKRAPWPRDGIAQPS